MEKTDSSNWGNDPPAMTRDCPWWLSKLKETSKLTLKSRGNCPGKLKVCVDFGAYACAVVRAATLIGPQRPTGLKHKRKHSYKQRHWIQHITGSLVKVQKDDLQDDTHVIKKSFPFFHLAECYLMCSPSKFLLLRTNALCCISKRLN